MHEKKQDKTTLKTLSLPSLLGVTFIVLKLCHVIEWSWVWVLSPFWIVAALWMLAFIVFMIVYARKKKEIEDWIRRNNGADF